MCRRNGDSGSWLETLLTSRSRDQMLDQHLEKFPFTPFFNLLTDTFKNVKVLDFKR